MASLSDRQLLEHFRDNRDPEALNEIVRRYIGLVHSAAQRQVRDPHLAADITQAVFIVLVRRADSIRPDTVLPAWLFTVTRHAVANARRVLSRQRRYETRRAAMIQNAHAPAADASAELADEIRSVLDDGIARLSSGERQSVLLHFFGHRTHREVGEALGLSEEAARKRVGRAIERLRTLLTSRADAAPAMATIVSVIAAESAAGAEVASQTALVASTANVALLANAVAPSAGTTIAAAIAQGVVRTIRMARLKTTAAACGVAVLLMLLTATSLLALTRRSSSQPPPRSESSYSVELARGMTARVVGVSTFPPSTDTWFAADGRGIDLPDERLLETNLNTAVPPQYLLAVRIDYPTTDNVRLMINGSDAGTNGVFKQPDHLLLVCVFSFQSVRSSASATLAIADGNWTTVASNEQPQSSARRQAADIGDVTFDPIQPHNGGARVVVRHPAAPNPTQVIVVDLDGQTHAPTSMIPAAWFRDFTMRCTFDVPPERIGKVILQSKPFTTFVDVSDIALERDRITRPKLVVRLRTP